MKRQELLDTWLHATTSVLPDHRHMKWQELIHTGLPPMKKLVVGAAAYETA